MIEPMFPMHGYQRHPIIIQEKESTVAVDHLLNLWRFLFFNNRLKALGNFDVHRQNSGTRIRLGLFNHDGHIYSGNLKAACVPGFNCYSCPGAIASCPLGSLQNALNAAEGGEGSCSAGYVHVFCREEYGRPGQQTVRNISIFRFIVFTSVMFRCRAFLHPGPTPRSVGFADKIRKNIQYTISLPAFRKIRIGSGFSTVSKRRGEQKNSLAACHIATRG